MISLTLPQSALRCSRKEKSSCEVGSYKQKIPLKRSLPDEQPARHASRRLGFSLQVYLPTYCCEQDRRAHPSNDVNEPSDFKLKHFGLRSGPTLPKDASIDRRGLWFAPPVSSAQPKAILRAGALRSNPVSQAAKLNSGPSQKVNNDRNDENRSE